MTRLEAGVMRFHSEPSDVQDLIGSALSQLGSRLEGRRVDVELAEDLPLVPLDFVWIGLVLVNIIDNALKFSPADSTIEIRAQIRDKNLEISAADRGIGIPSEDLLRIFDKFYRVQRPEIVTGTGLGLSISKGIVEAHGGSIWAENRIGGGTIITMRLPLGGITDQ
jgi:two-component system sensor histidine kinase KdpD